MENVKFQGRSFTETLSTGRMVKVGLSDDGAHWGLVLGNEDDPEDHVRFALSAEAFEAIERIAKRLRKTRSHLAWEMVLEWTPVQPDAEPADAP